MMYSVDAIFDGSSFKPLQPIPIKEDYEVIITFVKPVRKEDVQPKPALDSMTGDDIREKRRALFGCMKGEIWMADDFDAPLEEFREYME